MWRKLLYVGGLVWLTACSAGDLTGSTSQAEPPAADDPAVVTPADIPADIQEDSWARLPLLARDTLSDDDQRAFDIIVNPESRYAGGLRGPVAMWMYSPLMAEHMFPRQHIPSVWHRQRPATDGARHPRDGP